MLKWLHSKLSEGFYFPFTTKVLLKIEKGGSLNYICKEHVKEKGFYDPSGTKKAPPWVSELYQFLFLVFGFVVFFLSKYLSSIEWLSLLVSFVFIYRILENFFFTLNWIFVHKVKLHDFRRSIMGFLLNIVELALYISIITILCGFAQEPINKFELLYDHIVGILTLKPPANVGCKILMAGEFFVSVFLVLVVLAGLVGRLIREDLKSRPGIS